MEYYKDYEHLIETETVDGVKQIKSSRILLEYMPDFLKDIAEYRELFKSLDIEVLKADRKITYTINQASILNCDESRVEEWEQFLRITPNGNLLQRKQFIVATLTKVSKLNKERIEDIVNVYTGGGGAIVTFHNSTIDVKIKPPENGEVFIFDDIERTLNKLKPAHLLLSVARFYSTLQAVKDNFTTYENLKTTFLTYTDLKNYIE